MRTLNNKELAQLVKKAQYGDKGSLNRLAEEVRVYLHEYVLRLTLQEDLTQDIIQESILEMFKVFHKLKNADRFHAWLDGIAFNKVRSHYGRKWRHKTTSLSNFDGELADHEGENALAEMINHELQQIVIKSMRELSPRYRTVIIMRCYKDMSFAEIAESFRCSKFGAQSLFYRAKRTLAKKLEGYGLGKGCLLTALILFGKLTSTAKASAASVSVTASTLKVGTAATIMGMAASKTVIVSLLAASVITSGTIAVTQGMLKFDNSQQKIKTEIFIDSQQNEYVADKMHQSWLYFPEGSGNSVMMRLLKFNDSGQNPYCQYLQNQHANYFYDKDTVSINNYRMYNSDFSVRRLPTDNKDMIDFLTEVEGIQSDIKYVPGKGKGLLVISGYVNNDNDKISMIKRHSNLLEEEYFQFNWPQSAKVVDNRDEMHKRGWTYFRIDGRINGNQVTGTGRIPFVYQTSKQYSPWLKIQFADSSQIIDSTNGALVFDNNGKTIETYEAGTFFRGLSRPWMGLHSIDTVRRDAAKEHIAFDTKLVSDTDNAEVTLTYEQTKLIYTINMEIDVVEKISFSTDDGEGELNFSYLQDIENIGNEFTQPRTGRSWSVQQDSGGILWLLKLVNSHR